MNSMTLKGNWNILKGKVREKWGKLTDDDMDQIEGRSEQLLGKVQKAYGVTKEEAQDQIDAFQEESGIEREEEMDSEEMDIEELTLEDDDDEPTFGQGRTSRGIDKEMD